MSFFSSKKSRRELRKESASSPLHITSGDRLDQLCTFDFFFLPFTELIARLSCLNTKSSIFPTVEQEICKI